MNWSDYNKNLIKRGNINFWLSEDIKEWWYEKNSGPLFGRPLVYSNKAIEATLTIRYLFKMPLRMVEGFMNSFFKREGLSIRSASYSQLSRRTSSLSIPEIRLMPGEKVHMAFDSTGLKVYGEGEWKVRTHGASKRRTWRKVHFGIDIKDLTIKAAQLTKNSIDDATVAEKMLLEAPNNAIDRVLGDGAYDREKMYNASRKIGAKLITPPARNARQQKDLINPAKLDRDNAISRIRKLGNDEAARKQWKKEVGYHKRSLAETTMYRFKNTFSDRLMHRKFENQSVEIALKVKVLNEFAKLGFSH